MNDFELIEIESIIECGEEECYDIGNFEDDCADDEGNFICNDILVHNCIPEYVARRDDPRELWKKKEDPRAAEMLSETYGIVVFQEDLAKMWTRFGGLTVPEAEKARKAVAKKKKEEIVKLGPRIVASMIKNKFPNDPVPQNEDGIYEGAKPYSAQGYWNRMVSFGRYAFNRCLGKNTLLEHAENGIIKTIEEWANVKNLKLWSYDPDSNTFFIDDAVEFIDTGIQEIFEIKFDNGIKQSVTMGHKFMCDDKKMHTVKDILDNDLNIIQFDDNKRQHKSSYDNCSENSDMLIC